MFLYELQKCIFTRTPALTRLPIIPQSGVETKFVPFKTIIEHIKLLKITSIIRDRELEQTVV